VPHRVEGQEPDPGVSAAARKASRRRTRPPRCAPSRREVDIPRRRTARRRRLDGVARNRSTVPGAGAGTSWELDVASSVACRRRAPAANRRARRTAAPAPGVRSRRRSARVGERGRACRSAAGQPARYSTAPKAPRSRPGGSPPREVPTTGKAGVGEPHSAGRASSQRRCTTHATTPGPHHAGMLLGVHDLSSKSIVSQADRSRAGRAVS